MSLFFETRLDSDGVNRREKRLPRVEPLVARREFSLSFGSCSFAEPRGGLRPFGLF